MTTQKMKKRNEKNTNVNNSIDMSILIKTQLILKKIKQKEIADQLKVGSSAVSRFIAGTRKSRNFNKWVKKNLKIAI